MDFPKAAELMSADFVLVPTHKDFGHSENVGGFLQGKKLSWGIALDCVARIHKNSGPGEASGKDNPSYPP